MKSKTEMMAAMYKRRVEAGMVRLCVWLPSKKALDKVKAFADKLKHQ